MLTQGPTVRPSLWGGTFLDKNAKGAMAVTSDSAVEARPRPVSRGGPS